MTELSRITWRRFLILIKGLSPNSALANQMAHRKRARGNVTEVPYEHAESTFVSLFGGTQARHKKPSA